MPVSLFLWLRRIAYKDVDCHGCQQSKPIMSPTFEEYGYTVADVQSLMSAGLHPTILLAFCHGIHTCIFFMALYYIIESTQHNRKRITLAGIVAFLWITNTVTLSLEWEYVDQQFITHGASLETEFKFYFDGNVSAELVITILRVLSVLVADLIVIWRCWVLYRGNLKVIAVPSLCVVIETISACIVIAPAVADITSRSVSQTHWSLVYYSMTVATNSLCTLLIVLRIMRVSGIGASLKTYRGIIEILVESAAMYAIVYIALLIAYAYQLYNGAKVLTIDVYPKLVSMSITGIAPTLIIARVMAGKSRPDDSWTRPSLPHMRSNVLSTTESLRFASAPTTTTGHATANIDLEAQVTDERGGDGDNASQKQSAVKV
ncbi:hypothetical protein CPB85DRAFT_692368 [Mucidula mucida]|nr:hypothetical protein CPB85DRAFT_692368 [Mucidula mucida]